jgi:hypothetical protein
VSPAALAWSSLQRWNRRKLVLKARSFSKSCLLSDGTPGAYRAARTGALDSDRAPPRAPTRRSMSTCSACRSSVSSCAEVKRGHALGNRAEDLVLMSDRRGTDHYVLDLHASHVAVGQQP